ncbi:DctP family TRAP transporter solute-binding subunit [uncultured Cohaesibacter sp.]|uniref:DctP family TRAP transporter solute-binding subunit n=1 Tax=uncultured Cohaesibacter sp. TaxID=1002546 RepID=UPI0029C86049|nr:DctP family TRAP transporter solute-binding subunit [uncultured Cohaesibacter sp.]
MTYAVTAPAMENAFSYTNHEVFAREVEARSGARIAVTFLPGGQLGGVESTINQVRDGVIQANDPSDVSLAPIFPEIQVLSLPYAFTSRDVAWRVLDGPFGQKLADLAAEKTGLRPLAWFENGGFRNFTSADKEMKTVDDLAGLKMRVPPTPMYLTIVESLGMSPTPVPWGELYTALQTGVADGQENAIPTFMVPKLYEVQKQMIMDGHIYAASAVAVNEEWYQGLPDDLKAVINQAANVAKWTNRGLAVSNEMAGRNYLEGIGVNINDVTAAEKERFRALAQPAARRWLEGEIGSELINDMQAAIATAEEELGYR